MSRINDLTRRIDNYETFYQSAKVASVVLTIGSLVAFGLCAVVYKNIHAGPASFIVVISYPLTSFILYKLVEEIKERKDKLITERNELQTARDRTIDLNQRQESTAKLQAERDERYRLYGEQSKEFIQVFIGFLPLKLKEYFEFEKRRKTEEAAECLTELLDEIETDNLVVNEESFIKLIEACAVWCDSLPHTAWNMDKYREKPSAVNIKSKIISLLGGRRDDRVSIPSQKIILKVMEKFKEHLNFACYKPNMHRILKSSEMVYFEPK